MILTLRPSSVTIFLLLMRLVSQWSYIVLTLDFFCGMRACEIKAVQWKHISWEQRKLSIRRSKTPAGWRDPSLNDTCLEALRELHGRASALGFADPDH